MSLLKPTLRNGDYAFYKLIRSQIISWFNSRTIHIIVLVFISCTILVPKIKDTPLHDWDESRHAINALEMVNSGDWITATYNNGPDMANIKFPLGAWLIAINYKLFGVNEISVRLWSVIFTVLTTVLVYLWGSLFQNRWLGLLAALIFISSTQVAGLHAGVTGDYDAGASFFLTLSLFLFTIAYKKKRESFLFYSMVSVGLGTMYKSFVPGFIPLIIIFICLLFSKEMRYFLNFKNILICAGIIAIIISPWLIVRSMSDSSFVSKLLRFDYWNRLTEAVDNHAGSFWYYIASMKASFYPWLYFLPLGLFFVVKIYKKYKDDSSLILPVSFFTIFFIFSIAQTKNVWYILPIFPVMSVIVAIFWAVVWMKFSKLKFNIILAVALLVFLIVNIIAGVLNANLFFNAQNDIRRNNFSTLINQEFIKKDLLSSDVIVHQTIIAQSQSNLFYLKKLLNDKFVIGSEILCDLKQNQTWIVSIDIKSLRGFIDHCPDRKVIAAHHRGLPIVVYAIIK